MMLLNISLTMFKSNSKDTTTASFDVALVFGVFTINFKHVLVPFNLEVGCAMISSGPCDK